MAGHAERAVLAEQLRAGADQTVLRSLSGVDLSQLDLVRAGLSRANLAGADLSGANLSGADLSGANLTGANLTGANLAGANLARCHLPRADLGQANLAQADLHDADLARADLSQADLRDTDLRDADLRDAILREAILRSANLRESFAGGATFRNADLREANFDLANLTGADLCNVNLLGTKLRRTVLHDALLLGTRLYPNLLTADLRRCCVDWKSVALSLRMHELLVLLTRTGMPEVAAIYLLDSLRSIDETDLFTMLQSVFLSYGGPDHNFAERLRNELTANGVKTWFFPKDAEFGARLHRHIQAQINSYDRMILCCSEASLRREGVLHEIEEVLEREQDEGGTAIMIPIMLCDLFESGRTPPEWWPKGKEHIHIAIRRRVAADFRGTMEDPEKWTEQLSRLLKALRKKPSEERL